MELSPAHLLMIADTLDLVCPGSSWVLGPGVPGRAAMDGWRMDTVMPCCMGLYFLSFHAWFQIKAASGEVNRHFLSFFFFFFSVCPNHLSWLLS